MGEPKEEAVEADGDGMEEEETGEEIEEAEKGEVSILDDLWRCCQVEEGGGAGKRGGGDK